ncbi:MAG: hypothetical protein ACRC80_07060 [Waterburya sp.]
MNQQRLKAYLDLIQGLLSCPRGEEWILLRQHEKLVNPELVEVMEQVASNLATEGEIKAAKYLHNWAGKLHHILTESVPIAKNNNDKTEAYLKLIQALLSCPEGSEAEILAAHQELIGPQLVRVMKQVASQMAEEGDEQTASFLNNLAIELNRTWLQQHEFQPTFKKEVATDPWLNEDSPVQNPSVTETQTADSEAKVIEQPLETSSPFKIESDAVTETQSNEPTESKQLGMPTAAMQPDLPDRTSIEANRQIIQQLETITESLVKLETTLASRLQPSNPLWYMDILEKAEAANWILSTEEVEQLIGVKPQCHHDETSYHRGNWVFVKVGKVGAQTGWRVQKQTDSVR